MYKSFIIDKINSVKASRAQGMKNVIFEPNFVYSHATLQARNPRENAETAKNLATTAKNSTYVNYSKKILLMMVSKNQSKVDIF